MKKIIVIVAGILALGGLFWLGSLSKAPVPGATASAEDQLKPSLLVTEETSFDFGSIRMADGIVRRTFSVKNAGAEPLPLERLYTSCMCTTALFKQGADEKGPFGMPGHGIVPKLNATLAPGEKAEVEVAFDPAAHGPAGVGRIERAVYLESPASKPLVLEISATVTP